MRNMRYGRLFLGMVAGCAAGGILCALGVVVIAAATETVAAVTVPSLVLIPLVIGLVAAGIWSPLELSLGHVVLHTLSCTVLALGMAALIFREGVICLIILSPMLYIAML